MLLLAPARCFSAMDRDSIAALFADRLTHAKHMSSSHIISCDYRRTIAFHGHAYDRSVGREGGNVRPFHRPQPDSVVIGSGHDVFLGFDDSHGVYGPRVSCKSMQMAACLQVPYFESVVMRSGNRLLAISGDAHRTY